MSGPFNTPPRARKPSINITPLIDVMFLLLIFFMVSSTFRDYPGIDVTLPKAASAETQDETGHELVVTDAGEYLLDGEAIDAQDLETELRALVVEDPRSAVVLRADEAARFQFVVSAIDAAKKVGVTNLVIPTVLPDATEESPQP